MDNQDWREIVGALVDTKRSLATAWQIFDGTDGAAPGVGQALTAALAGIDATYAIEYVNAYNADVASASERSTRSVLVEAVRRARHAHSSRRDRDTQRQSEQVCL